MRARPQPAKSQSLTQSQTVTESLFWIRNTVLNPALCTKRHSNTIELAALRLHKRSLRQSPTGGFAVEAMAMLSSSPRCLTAFGTSSLRSQATMPSLSNSRRLSYATTPTSQRRPPASPPSRTLRLPADSRTTATKPVTSTYLVRPAHPSGAPVSLSPAKLGLATTATKFASVTKSVASSTSLPRTARKVIVGHFRGEYLAQHANGRLEIKYTKEHVYPGVVIYLRLPHALNDERMLALILKKLWVPELLQRLRWKREQHVPPYMRWTGPRNPRLIYRRAPQDVKGIYFMHGNTAMAFNDGIYAGPFFVVYIAKSDDIYTSTGALNSAPSYLLSRGTQECLFGIEVCAHFLRDAEANVHLLMTRLGFSETVVNMGQDSSFSTFEFNKSLPLVHDVAVQSFRAPTSSNFVPVSA
ncbi:hypothetical protein PC121_g22322 [Phytophthora cactorum]|nr:hypothetical protein PC121_g22322 [Phytophthora cactorum]